MFIDKVISLAFGLVFLFVLSCDGPTSDTVVEEGTPVSKNKTLRDNPVFWDYAASSNMLQTELGKLAAEKGSTEEIRLIGQKAADFHYKALEQLRSLVASQTKVHVPDSLGAADHDLVEEFKLLKGEDFDTRYHDYILNSHKMQLERYQEALSIAENQGTRKWLQAMLVHLREQLNSVAATDSVTHQP
ncbi:DUF4142 domain-containing protein [Pontibacter sp. MBLB2868]|uniref:DUF4142 domain-containing protein n=1 Tax=Pontibacter sp. MBLB2868 TaxID=3451555 RepID=UPI003F74B1E2